MTRAQRLSRVAMSALEAAATLLLGLPVVAAMIAAGAALAYCSYLSLFLLLSHLFGA